MGVRDIFNRLPVRLPSLGTFGLARERHWGRETIFALFLGEPLFLAAVLSLRKGTGRTEKS